MKNWMYFSLFLLLAMLNFPLLAQDDCANRALHFDGIDDYVQLANSPLNGTPDFTIEIWFYSEDQDGQIGCSGNFERIVGCGGDRFELGTCENELAIVINNTAAATIATINHFQWYHLAATRAGNTFTVYLNCEEVYQEDIPGLTLDNIFRIGRWPGGGASGNNEHWTGKLDELRIWDNALTQNLICDQSDCTLSGTEVGLVDYYPFDQGMPNNNNAGVDMLEDLTLSPNDGTLIDFTLDFSTSNWVCSETGIEHCCENLCLDFDGSDDYVRLANSPVMGTGDFTIECWFQSEDTDGLTGCGGNFERIIGCGGDRFELGVCENDLAIVVNNTAASTITPINQGQWYHLTATRSGNTVKVYLDCEEVYDQTFSNFTLDNVFNIGRWPGGASGNNETWDGKIDELRIWDIAQSNSEVCENRDCILTGQEPNLVGWYSFDQGIAAGINLGETMLWDASSTANHGTNHNFGLIAATSNFVCSPIELSDTCCVDPVLHLDGMDDYVQASFSPISGNVDFTVECWFTNEDADGQTGCSGNFERIIACGGDRFELGVCDTDLAFVANSSSATTLSATINNNQWYHLAATRDGDEIKIYLDGNLVHTATGFASMSLDNIFRIGRWAGGSSGDNETWHGLIDEVRVWSYPRTQSQISAALDCEFTDPALHAPHLLLYFDFNEGTPNGNNTGITQVLDQSANGNHGSLNNFTLTGGASNYLCSGEIPCQTTVAVKEQLPAERPIRVFPNPTNGQVTIEWELPDVQNATVALYNPMGQMVLHQQVQTPVSQINIHHLPAGMYWLTVQTESGDFRKTTLIKH